MNVTGHPHDETDGARTLALASSLIVVGTFLTVFYRLTELFGGTPWLIAYVLVALAAATLVAREVPPRAGLVAGGLLLALGAAGYLVLLPRAYYGLFTVDQMAEDVVGWLTGRSVVLMLEADLWAVTMAPAPVFLTWYLALRDRYDAAALAGGGTLAFFVLTGDLGGEATLLGMAGVLGLLGFGAVAAADGGWKQLQEIGLVVGLAMLLTRFVQVVPASGVAERPTGGGGSRSLERSLLGTDDRLRVGGPVSLSPTPRFTVETDEPSYWHARSFDHYTGRGWRHTDESLSAARPLQPPPGGGVTIQQSFTAESTVGSMPAAWKPVLLGRDARSLAEVTPAGDLEPSAPLDAGTTYQIISQRPEWSDADLRSAGWSYSDAMEARYTQLPESLPERLVERTDEITADAGTPYETALAVQEWLETNKEYSLNVQQPNWDIADAFTFSLDAGYCVYFATTMAVMLRTQGVPARFVVGYSPGEQVAEKQWRLRGLHSHAWVEVYFEDVGWVHFDPTPPGPRQEAEAARLQRASSAGPDDPGGSDGDGASGDPASTPSPTPTPTSVDDDPSAPNESAGGVENPSELISGPTDVTNETTTPDGSVPGVVRAEGDRTRTPTPRRTGGRGDGGDRLWMLGALATLAFGSVRLGVAQSAAKRVWLHYQPRTGPPAHDVERALGRLEYHYARRFRERREGETHRQYLEALEAVDARNVDRRAWRVLALYHRSRYGDGVSKSEATEAVRLVDELVR